MMKPNDFCVNDVKFRCVWGEPDRFIPGRLKFGGGGGKLERALRVNGRNIPGRGYVAR